jgi:hypothetical protein
MCLARLRPYGFDFVWIILWGGIFGALTMAASQRLSATFDEPFNLRAGLQHWRTGSTFTLMRYGNMPLPADVETLPVYVSERLRGRQWDLTTEFDRILAIARAGNLFFWFVLLTYGCAIGRSLGSAWAGRWSVAALAVEPNLFAHAGLATTDLAVTACVLAFGFHYWLGRDASWPGRVGVPAIFFGLAILAKASALVFAPICVAAIEVERLWQSGRNVDWLDRARHTARGLFAGPFLCDCFAMGGLALVLVFVWCGTDWQPLPELVAQANSIPEDAIRPPAVWLAQHFTIFNNAAVGIVFQIGHNLRGQGAYLLGATAPRSFWYYFPVVLSMKLATLYLAAIATAAIFARRHLFNWACLASLLLLVFSFTYRVQIGVRMILPLIALGTVGLVAALANASIASSRPTRIAAAAGASLVIGWTAVSGALAWPDAVCYINELWGGPAHGERLLSDSNYDWGQGLKELDQWRSVHGLPELAIWYFGTDPAAQQSPFRNTNLQGREIPDERALTQIVGDSYLAVGTTILYGAYVKQPAWLLDRLRSLAPAGRTRTFLIYDMKDF